MNVPMRWPVPEWTRSNHAEARAVLQNEQAFAYSASMPRNRIIPDSQVFTAVQSLLDQGGDKAVTFGTVAAATGLAPSTLVQRYGSLAGMLRATRIAGWDALDKRTIAAIAETADRGVPALLKALGAGDVHGLASDLRDPALAAPALAWRARVEAAVAQRLGGGQKAREAASLLFAAWQGQALWGRDGDSGFRLKDVIKRLI